MLGFDSKRINRIKIDRTGTDGISTNTKKGKLSGRKTCGREREGKA